MTEPTVPEATARRIKEIALRALDQWAGWLDDARGTTDPEVEELREELDRLLP